MSFYELPSNSSKLLAEIVEAENPTQLLNDKFEGLNQREDSELRGIIRELCEQKYITISMWADNRPYNVVVNNSARTYKERVEKNKNNDFPQNSFQIVKEQSVRIGDGNTLKNVSIVTGGDGSLKKESFYEKHPLICNIGVSLAVGFILLFSFWDNIIRFIEGVV